MDYKEYKEPKTRKEQKGRGKDKDSPYSAKHVRIAAVSSSSTSKKGKK